MKEHKVYHIREKGVTDLSQGYIGVTSNWAARKSKHKHSGKLTGSREMVCLYTYSNAEDAYSKENELRPFPNMGLNLEIGGFDSGRFKQGERTSIRTEFKEGDVPHNKYTGKHYILTSPEGEEFYVVSLVEFCAPRNLTPQNLRKVAKGLRKHHKGWSARVPTDIGR